MSTHASEATHKGASNALITTVWLILLVLTLVEVFLAYERVPVNIMLTVLMGLSIIKAALIMAYFMHLRFERLGLFLTLVPAMVFCICMMMVVFFPDSLRLLHYRTH
jgi:cytochrome c oxidase subunit 4